MDGEQERVYPGHESVRWLVVGSWPNSDWIWRKSMTSEIYFHSRNGRSFVLVPDKYSHSWVVGSIRILCTLPRLTQSWYILSNLLSLLGNINIFNNVRRRHNMWWKCQQIRKAENCLGSASRDGYRPNCPERKGKGGAKISEAYEELGRLRQIDGKIRFHFLLSALNQQTNHHPVIPPTISFSLHFN